MVSRILSLFLAVHLAASRSIPWEYKGYDSFPTNWFGANPTGEAIGEDNATLAVMSKHHLVGWGWQQGMYDIPCSISTAQQCASNAANTLENYTRRLHLPDVPSFQYRNMMAALLNFEDVNQALNCTVNWATYPANKQVCHLNDPSTEKLRREWFVHDRQGRVCGGREGTPALQMSWVKSAPGAMDYWENVIGGWLVSHLSPSKAVFLDVMDNGANYAATLNNSIGNCSVADIDPVQWNKDVYAKEVEANIVAAHKIAAKLKPLGKAVIVNAGSRLSDDPSKALVPFKEFFQRLNDIENIIWYYEAWNSSLDLETALFMREQGMPKLVHWFGDNETKLEYQMAAFLIAQGDHDYFSASREWTDGGWNWHPAYASTKCGRPLHDPVQSGVVYTREFEYCDVRVDLGCDIPSRDGCGTITKKASDARKFFAVVV